MDIKRGTVTKLDKKNTITLKKIVDDSALVNYGVILIFPVYGWFGAFRNPDSGRMVFDSYILISSSLFSYKAWKRKLKNL